MNQGGTSEIGAGSAEIELPLSDANHLFNPPEIDPYSKSEPEVLGISGFDYLMSYLHIDRKRQQTRKLLLQLPAEKSRIDAAEITRGLHRMADVRLMRDGLELRNIYRYAWRVAFVAVILLATCLAISHIFTMEITAWMGPLLRKTLEYGFEIVGWVLLWHPVEALFFTPLAIRHRMRSLRAIASMDVAIKTDAPTN